MEALTVNYKGIEINVTEINTDYVTVHIEESEKIFDFPYDVSFNEDYRKSNNFDLFYMHPELLETIGEWALNERANMIAEIMAGLNRVIVLNQSGLSIVYTLYSKIGHLDIAVFNDNKMVKRWACVYLGVNAFKFTDGYTLISSVENELVKFLNK